MIPLHALLEETFDNPSVADVVSHLGYQGKALRPKLVLACAELCCYQGKGIGLLAKSVEYIHMASLFHDDVIDEGQQRRGKPCAHTIWGNRTAVLVGDFLINHVFSLLLRLENLDLLKAAQSMLQDLIQGQLQESELSFETPVEEFLSLIQKKTSSLFAFSCSAVGLLAQLPQQHCEALKLYGTYFGYSFQMKDDVYDYCAPQETGKNTGQDWAQKKVTLPVYWAYQNASDQRKKQILKVFSETTTEAFQQLTTWIEEEGGFSKTLEEASVFSEKAIAALFPYWTESSIASSGLRELIDPGHGSIRNIDMAASL